MKLINLEGMALIGPGSEWFWTMLSGVVLAVTFIAIYRQLRVQRSASAIAQAGAIQREWQAERLIRSRLAVLVALRDGVVPADVPTRAAGEVGDFWEQVAYLAREGYVDRRLVYEYFSQTCRLWWAWLAPMTRAERTREENPRMYVHFEWLAGVLAEMDRDAGVTTTFDAAYLARALEPTLRTYVDAIHSAEELRSVILRPAVGVGDAGAAPGR